MPVLNIGLPDQFPEHGNPKILLQQYGLDSDGITESIRQRLKLLS